MHEAISFYIDITFLFLKLRGIYFEVSDSNSVLTGVGRHSLPVWRTSWIVHMTSDIQHHVPLSEFRQRGWCYRRYAETIPNREIWMKPSALSHEPSLLGKCLDNMPCLTEAPASPSAIKVHSACSGTILEHLRYGQSFESLENGWHRFLCKSLLPALWRVLGRPADWRKRAKRPLADYDIACLR